MSGGATPCEKHSGQTKEGYSCGEREAMKEGNNAVTTNVKARRTPSRGFYVSAESKRLNVVCLHTLV